MRRLSVLAAFVTVVVLTGASAAWACGSLVAANGSVELVQTTTLAAHHDGVEHYVTSFEFESDQESFGSIIPLPAEPTTVERAGDWTLPRLEQEVAPPAPTGGEFNRVASASADEVDVLRQTRIDSLDVTILRGGGEDVAAWAAEQGFTISDDTPAVLEFYSQRSPYFMAAKFDADAAKADGFEGGDGIPIHLAMPFASPWVPLHILSADMDADEVVQADVFLLTDRKPQLLAGPGLTLERSEAASDLLLDDLRSDQNSAWVPEKAWLTYLKLEVEAADLSYDLATDVSGNAPRVIDTGLVRFNQMDDLKVPGGDNSAGGWPGPVTVAIAAAAGLGIVAGGLALRRPA